MKINESLTHRSKKLRKPQAGYAHAKKNTTGNIKVILLKTRVKVGGWEECITQESSDKSDS